MFDSTFGKLLDFILFLKIQRTGLDVDVLEACLKTCCKKNIYKYNKIFAGFQILH